MEVVANVSIIIILRSSTMEKPVMVSYRMTISAILDILPPIISIIKNDLLMIMILFTLFNIHPPSFTLFFFFVLFF